ncbi:MAG: flavin reductase family protein [Phycisphaeraceae bacterium]
MTDKPDLDKAALAMGRVPSGIFILTAMFEERRMGMLASWVQQASFEPLMLSIAIAKGRPIMPLISNSHKFALCQIQKGDKVLMRKFAGKIDVSEDPFLGFELVSQTVNKSPVLAGGLGYFECDLVCHMDYEGDHDIFIGKVVGGNYFGGDPFVHVRESGLKY